MIEKLSLPSAPILIESIRAIGYSFESAIADLIDNSISAKAKKIDIFSIPEADPYVLIFDDGEGMDKKELEEAMRLGSRNPKDKRAQDDLGRFGLGLKSASLSQCRKLTIVSKKNGVLNGFSWDLDCVEKTNNWNILEYDDEEILALPKIELFEKVKNGTYVLLRNFDRIEGSTNDLNKTLSGKIDSTRNHISLVFHRYIDEGLKININNVEVEALDPFLTKHKGTTLKKTQKLKIEGETITVKPYILPHFNKLKEEDYKKVGGKEDLKKNQGFYIYRNKRLIIWGTWFRISRQDELGKLARVMVEIPNSLDDIWEIDIKKSNANIPDRIKKQLYSCVDESILTSKEVFKFRGRKNKKSLDSVNYIWDRLESNNGSEYVINRDLPQLKILESMMDKEQLRILSHLLKEIEKSFPKDLLYAEIAEGNVNINDENERIDDKLDGFRICLENSSLINLSPREVYEMMIKSEPYSSNEKLKKLMEEEVKKYE